MRGKADRCRKQRGREYDAARIKELERLNKGAPVVVYNINVTVEPQGRFVLYVPRRRGGGGE